MRDTSGGIATIGTGQTTDQTTAVDPTGTAGATGTFTPPRPFGDDQAELDLIGVWGVPRYGDPQTWEATLEISADGTFAWREADADCALLTDARGAVWVENNQLVLHYEDLVGEMPWSTTAATGLDVTPPFRVRLGYAPAGTTLALAAPEGLTASAPWEGIALLRQTTTSGPEGTWRGESQLEALVPGQVEAQVIVVDRYTAELWPGGWGLRSTARTFYWPSEFVEPTVFFDAAWVDGTPGSSAGAATVGGRPFAYDAVRLHSFGQWDALRADPQTRCL